MSALTGVDLEVGAGEIVSLVGPNGAGKSTLLRIIGTTVVPDAGAVSVGGRDAIADPPSARQALGLMLGDERSFYWRISGRRNLEFFAGLHGMSRAEAAAEVDRLLALVGLAKVADRVVSGYSSGMRARLSLGRALLSGPRLLLLDEPTQSLDPVAAVAFRELALTLARDDQAGILLATHDLHEAVAISDRVAVLVNGRLVHEQPVEGTDASALEEILLEHSHGERTGHGWEVEP